MLWETMMKADRLFKDWYGNLDKMIRSDGFDPGREFVGKCCSWL